MRIMVHENRSKEYGIIDASSTVSRGQTRLNRHMSYYLWENGTCVLSHLIMIDHTHSLLYHHGGHGLLYIVCM